VLSGRGKASDVAAAVAATVQHLAGSTLPETEKKQNLSSPSRPLVAKHPHTRCMCYAYNTHTQTCHNTFAHTPTRHARMCRCYRTHTPSNTNTLYMYIYIHIYMYIYIHIFIHICMYIYFICVCIHILCICEYIYICVYVGFSIYIYLYIRIYM
jgi:hypothetical protein